MSSIAPIAAAPRSFDTGAESSPQGQLPVALSFTAEEERAIANPLQHLPVIGMIYRAFSGETLPAPVQIADSVVTGALFGGPLGVIGALAFNFLREIISLGPDTSRPPVPEGMTATGSESGVLPTTPGATQMAGGYITLATTLPDFLGGSVDKAPATTMMAGLAAYDWQHRAGIGNA